RHNVRTKALPVFVPCLRHPGNDGFKCRDGGASLSRHAGYGDNQREETHTRDLSPHVYITPQPVSSNSSIPFVSFEIVQQSRIAQPASVRLPWPEAAATLTVIHFSVSGWLLTVQRVSAAS